jgi:hypothetical protein
MGWLVTIICIILVAIFWRVLLPIAAVLIVLALVGGGLTLLYLKSDKDRTERQQAKAEHELRQRIATAQATAKGQARTWEVWSETDPASGARVPRNALVLSDDGLCRLQVEERINRDRLAGLYCSGLKVSSYNDVEVKFDNRATSDRMRLERFSNGDDVYIPSSQYNYSGQLPYNEFLQRMTTAKKVALLLTVEGAGQHWIAFSLAGSAPALIRIGAISPKSDGTSSAEKKSSTAKKQSETKATKKTPSEQSATPATTPNPTSPSASKDGDKPRLPANAELNVYGNDWVCIRGYRRSGNECVPVQLPRNAELNLYGNDWKCSRGYRRSGNECVTVEIPVNAELNVYGNDWKCVRGFRRNGDACVAVQLPAHAELNVYGNDWECVRGYRRSADECVIVRVPSNAELNVYGNDWRCVRGYRREGVECIPVGVSPAVVR